MPKIEALNDNENTDPRLAAVGRRAEELEVDHTEPEKIKEIVKDLYGEGTPEFEIEELVEAYCNTN